MKGRINLDYERSPDPYDRHRALYLYLPTTEMTGDYTCKVSTLQNDVTATKRMTVFGEYTDTTQQIGTTKAFGADLRGVFV